MFSAHGSSRTGSDIVMQAGGSNRSSRRPHVTPCAHRNRARRGSCSRRLGAGPPEIPVQSDRAQQPDRRFERRRAAVLARNAAQGIARCHHGRRHAARSDGRRRQDHAALAASRRHGLRQHGYLEDGRRRSPLRGLRPRRDHAHSRQGARRMQRLPRRDRPADAKELECEAAGVRRQPASGVLVPQRDRRARRPEGQEDPRVQQYDARFPERRRRDRGEHGFRRGRSRAQQRRGGLRRHRQLVGKHGGLARGDQVALPDVARLGHQRRGRESRHVAAAGRAGRRISC